MKKLIEIKNIVKDFDGQRVLNGISLDIHENEFVTLLGPSGCGKTTLLRIIAGFLDADDGQVLFDGKDISGLPPYKREVNTVFQKYALFPHLNVYDNIAFGLNLKKQPKDIIEQKVKRMLRLVGLSGFDKRRITQMSGGQQQRVGIARAFVTKPKIVFADEPTGNLDSKTTTEVMELMVNKSRENNQTFILVTHDNGIARYADRIVTIVDGRIVRDEKNESIARTREEAACENSRESRRQADQEEDKVSATIPEEETAANMSTEGAE